MTDTVEPVPVSNNYYYEVTKIKKYERYMVGSIVLGSILTISTFLFFFRMWKVILHECDWAILDVYFIPPFHFVHYGMMIFVDPSEHLETLCFFGQIMMPVVAVVYSVYMAYQSYMHSSPLELLFYVALLIVPIATSALLPQNAFGVKYFRPFLRRPEGEVEAERLDIIKNFQLPPSEN